MFRYLTLLWDAADQEQAHAATVLSRRVQALTPRWREVFSTGTLRVFCVDLRPGSFEFHSLSADKGVLLGVVFERRVQEEDDAPSRKVSLTSAVSDAIVRTRGRWLIDNGWGNYVAFIGEPAAVTSQGTYWIIKDPTGSLPCFTTQYRRVKIFFSCIADCLELQLPFTVNPAFLRSHLAGGDDQEWPAFNEVSQLHRGECLEVSVRACDPMGRRMYWNPLSFVESSEAVDEPSKAVRVMRNVVRGCTSTWASCHEVLLLRLSGGLDSSIIAGCLSNSPARTRTVCYTYYNPQGRSDERRWARLAATHGELKHLECPVIPSDRPLDLALQMGPSIEPVPSAGFMHRSTMERQIAREHGATAVFTGDGGDSGFCSDSMVYAIPDYLRRHGFGPGLLRLVSQIALATEQSSFRVVIQALRRQLSADQGGERRSLLLQICKLVNPEVRASAGLHRHHPHPWFHDASPIPWSTIRRVGALVCTSDLYNSNDVTDPAAAEVVAPLYSQPVIETLLRIPIHTHFHGGRSRGLARAAFEREVPQPILQRLWKDRAPGFFDEVIELNRHFLRELFLDGVLVREGWLDKAGVEAALSMRPSKNDVLPGEILRHLDTEIWLRKWIGSARNRTREHSA